MAARRPQSDRSSLAETADFTEFENLLAELGAEAPTTGAEPGLDLKDVTIAELKQALAALRPLGDQLAEAERRRLETEAMLAEKPPAIDPAVVLEMQRELTALRTTIKRNERTLTRTRAQLTHRQRIAANRWREILQLRAERTRFKSECLRLQRESKSANRPATKKGR